MLHALIVLAQDAKDNVAGQSGSFLYLLPVLLLLFYLLILRPQRQQERERQALVTNLKKNDEILTNAGIYGTIVDVSETDDKITVKVADNVRLKMTKSSVFRNLTNEEAAKQAKAAKEAKA